MWFAANIIESVLMCRQRLVVLIAAILWIGLHIRMIFEDNEAYVLSKTAKHLRQTFVHPTTTTTTIAAAAASSSLHHHHHHQQQRRQLDSPDLLSDTTKTTAATLSSRIHPPARWTASNATLVVCTTVKETVWFPIQEWTDYYLGLGVTHIYMYDNNDIGNDSLQTWHRTYPEQTSVSLLTFPGDAVQQRAYQDCAVRAKAAHHTYILFIDTDEFLVIQTATAKSAKVDSQQQQQQQQQSRRRTTTTDDSSHVQKRTTTTTDHSNIIDFAETFAAHGHLAIYWRVFGTSGHVHHQPSLPVTLRFQCQAESSYPLNKYPKMLARADYLDPYSIKDVHKMTSTSGKIIWGREDNDDETAETADATATTSASSSSSWWFSRRNSRSRKHYEDGNPAYLYHYYFKSLEEYRIKRERGDAFRGKQYEHHERNIRYAQQGLGPDGTPVLVGTRYDTHAWDILQRNVPEYAVYNNNNNNKEHSLTWPCQPTDDATTTTTTTTPPSLPP